MLHPLTVVKSGELSDILHSYSSAVHELTSFSGFHKPMLSSVLVLQNLKEILK